MSTDRPTDTTLTSHLDTLPNMQMKGPPLPRVVLCSFRFWFHGSALLWVVCVCRHYLPVSWAVVVVLRLRLRIRDSLVRLCLPAYLPTCSAAILCVCSITPMRCYLQGRLPRRIRACVVLLLAPQLAHLRARSHRWRHRAGLLQAACPAGGRDEGCPGCCRLETSSRTRQAGYDRTEETDCARLCGGGRC